MLLGFGVLRYIYTYIFFPNCKTYNYDGDQRCQGQRKEIWQIEGWKIETTISCTEQVKTSTLANLKRKSWSAVRARNSTFKGVDLLFSFYLETYIIVDESRLPSLLLDLSVLSEVTTRTESSYRYFTLLDLSYNISKTWNFLPCNCLLDLSLTPDMEL